MSEDRSATPTLAPDEQTSLRDQTSLSLEARRSLDDALRATLAPNAFEPAKKVFAYAIDGSGRAPRGISPHLAIRPTTVDQLSVTMRIADESGAAVIPWGSGTHMALGNAPARYDIAISMTRLARLMEHEPADMTVTVEAGMTMAALQALLGRHGQFLPVDAPEQSTVGGMLALGTGGPSRHGYGLPRDWLIGCKIALADGTIVKGGGRVVKNVAGYDIPRLVVGSLGTLGVITEATFKVAPVPPAQQTVLFESRSLEDAESIVRLASTGNLALRAVAILADRDSSPTAAFWLAGQASAVERSCRELSDSAKNTDATLLTGGSSPDWWSSLETPKSPGWHGPSSPSLALRVVVPPYRTAELSGIIGEEGAGRTIAYPTTGVIVAYFAEAPAERSVSLVQELRKRAVEHGGSLVVTQATEDVKGLIDVWGDDISALSVMRRLKDQLDPRATLNPGRFVGGI